MANYETVAKLLGKMWSEEIYEAIQMECGEWQGEKECLEVINRCLNKGQVLKEWKMAILVLIEKEIKEGERVKYRPIYLLNGMGKLYEGMLTDRLRNLRSEARGLSGDTV